MKRLKERARNAGGGGGLASSSFWGSYPANITIARYALSETILSFVRSRRPSDSGRLKTSRSIQRTSQTLEMIRMGSSGSLWPLPLTTGGRERRWVVSGYADVTPRWIRSNSMNCKRIIDLAQNTFRAGLGCIGSDQSETRLLRTPPRIPTASTFLTRPLAR